MPEADLAPFEVVVTAAEVADLRRRLAATRWPEIDPDPAWALGTDIADLRGLCDRWAHGFDWDAFAARCNRHPQVRTTIDGTALHAIVAESHRAGATPLLLLHGWPSSVTEFFDVIEPLRAEHHVVVASLPGYAFSGPARTTAPPAAIAGLLVELMRRLGHPRFVVAGGDWGAIVAAWMASEHPDALAGHYSTMLPARPPAGAGDPAQLATDDERELFRRARSVMATGTGYQAIQGTKPHSLGYALTDSPAGLAGWISEKFRDWSDVEIATDRLLDNLSVYWLTGTITSSMRLYQAFATAPARFPDRRVEVPTGHAVYPGEILPTPRAWADAWFHVVHWSRMERGGHFAAMEVPGDYVADLLAFTATL